MDCSFENMCRTCMNEGGNLVSINKLYNREERIISYAEMLSSFIKTNVDDVWSNFNGIYRYKCLFFL